LPIPMRRIFNNIAVLLTAQALVACQWIFPGNFIGSQGGAQDTPRANGDLPKLYENGYSEPNPSESGQEAPLPLENDSIRVNFSGVDILKGSAVRERFQAMDYDELLWAVADCECAPRWSHRVLTRTLETYGSLPQVLVPQVREAILKDKRIQAVLQLPGGADSVISKIFASDSQLESTVRSNLLAQIQNAWQNPLKIGSSGKLYFDGFAPLPWQIPARSTGNVVRPDGFDVGSLAARWLLVASPPAPWMTGPGRSRQNLPLEQDIQLVSWARMMAEINYVLGVKRGFDGRIYGGLMLNPRDPSGNLLGFEMLPATGAPLLGLSGRLKIAYQPMSSLKLIVNGKEQWQRQAGSIDLSEQVLVWRAGAAIFKNLRLESRKYPAALFGSGDANIFPADSQRLGLAFLQGIQVLLGEEMVALDTMSIGDSYSIPEQRVQRSETNLMSMVRVANVLTAWSQEIQSIDSSGLSESDKTVVRDALPKLQDALRLSVLRSLRRSTDWQAFESGSAALPVAKQAELIATLARVEQQMMRSGFVRRRIAVLGQKLIDNLSEKLDSNSQLDLSPEEAIWCREALFRLKSYSANEAEIAALIQTIDAGINAWDAAVSI
jgi:hypothetical protein